VGIGGIGERKEKGGCKAQEEGEKKEGKKGGRREEGEIGLGYGFGGGKERVGWIYWRRGLNMLTANDRAHNGHKP